MKAQQIKIMIFSMLLIFIIPGLFASDAEMKELENKLGTASHKNKVDILNQLSKLCVYKNPVKAQSYAQQALDISIKIKYKQGECEALGRIGNSYYQLGDYPKCLDYYYKSLELALKTGNTGWVSSCYNVLGLTYLKIGNPDKAEELYFKALQSSQGAGDIDTDTFHIYNNLANLYCAQKKYDKALEIFEKILKVAKKTNNKDIISYTYTNMGVVNYYLKKYDASLEFMLKALRLHEEKGQILPIAATLGNIGEIYMYKKEYSKALNYLHKALKLVEEAKGRDLMVDIYHHFWNLYSQIGDHKKAFKFLKLYWELKDQLFNEKKSKQIAEMQVKFDSQRKEKENTILQKNIQIRELEINKQKNIRNFILVLLAFSLLWVWLAYNRYQAKQKANQLLTERNKVITKQKEELNQTLQELSKSESKIRAIFDNAGVGIGLVNKKEKFVKINAKWGNMLQCSPNQILNQNFTDFFHPEDRIRIRGYFEALLSGEINDFHLESRYSRGNDTFFWGDLHATPIVSSEGTIESIIFMISDISDKKKAEFSLRESEEKYRTLVENANYGIVITRESKIKFANSQFSKLSGYSPDKLKHSDLSNYIEPVPESAVKLSKKGKKFETVLFPKIGREIDVEISASEIFYEDHLADLLFIYDITEKRLLEKERIKNQDLEFMGTLVEKLAEYFDNIFINFIKSFQLIKTSKETGLKIRKMLIELEKALGKTLELSQTLSSLSKEKMNIQELCLREKIGDWLQQTTRDHPISIKLNVPDHLWNIAGNPKQIQLAITGLLSNIMKSEPPAGILKLEAENINVKKDYFPDLRQGRYVKLVITFQRKTKEIETKMITDDFGLVFALVYAIVKRHNGVIWMKFRDKESGSTVFEIYLPVYEGRAKSNKIEEGQKDK